MECKTSEGVVFRLLNLSQNKLKEVSPSKFLAKLLTENGELSWASFNHSNVTEVVEHVVNHFDLRLGASTQLLYPFTNPNTQVKKCLLVVARQC